MGSSTHKKQSRQPRRLLRGQAAATGLGGRFLDPESDELTVPLVHIDVDILSTLRGQESVRVEDTGSSIQVQFGGGILGDVAPHYEEAVRQGGFSRGVVDSIKLDPPAVSIRLST